MISSPFAPSRMLIVITIACTGGLLTGCNPANFGILWPGQKDWHHRASSVIDDVRTNDPLSLLALESRLGEPDAVVPGEAFITGQKELDAFRAFTLCLAREPDGDARRLYDQSWKTSTILVYDEKAHYPWPIVGSWRSYLFQVRNDKVVAGWDTFPRWRPWQDDYWDDVRQRIGGTE